MEKTLKYIGNIIDCTLSALIYIIITVFLSRLDPAAVFDNALSGIDISSWLALGIMFVLLYSLMRISVLFDHDMKKEFCADGDGIYSPRKHLHFIFLYPKIYIGLSVSVIIFFSLKTEQFAKPIFDLFLKAEPTFIYKLLLLPVYLFSVVLIYYLASRSASKYWEEETRTPLINKMKYTLTSRIRRLFTLTVAYSAGAAIFILLSFQISGIVVYNSDFIYSRRKVTTLIMLITLFAVIPFISKQTSALLKRRKFIKELKVVCEEYHCSLSPIKSPYASLFKLNEGFNFDFERDGKIYACKMLYSKHRLRPMTFFEEGMGAHEKIINVKKTELFRIRKWFEYSFESDYKKILVINPIPKKIMANYRGRGTLLDNGDSIEGYKIYSASALVNAISRNTLDR